MNPTIENQMLYIKEDDKMIAYLTFPIVRENVVNINHTYVHPSKRGLGLAKILMDHLYDYLKENNLKATATCSYADAYFKKNKDKQDVLYEGE